MVVADTSREKCGAKKPGPKDVSAGRNAQILEVPGRDAAAPRAALRRAARYFLRGEPDLLRSFTNMNSLSTSLNTHLQGERFLHIFDGC